MPVDEFHSLATHWMTTAKHPRYNRSYSQLVYQPMLEVMKYLRDNGYRTYIVTGGARSSFARTRNRCMASRRTR
jgi:phosphoserine phosphatase